METGNRTSSSTGGGNDIQYLTPLNCTVNLNLNSEEPSSYNKAPTAIFNHSPYYYNHQDSNIFNTQMLNHQNVSGFCSDSSKDGKKLFTANQWEELERQTMIYKYIMASIPVPAHLLSTQSNRVNVGLRFSNGSDPEPWRCRRTDGKKWRCAKDIAPDQKYCEHHSHKTRSRSRKPVETQTRNTKDKPTVLAAANQQTKCSDLFLKNDVIPVSQLNNWFQPPMQKLDQVYKQDENNGNHQHKSYLDHKSSPYLNATSGTGVDIWSSIGSVVDDCSLTLSMQSCGSGIEFDNESFQMAVGLLNGDREGFEDVYKPHDQWLSQGSWASSGSTPGGPLGEALCLGIAGTTNSPQSDAFHNGYSNSTTTSGSCEGGGDHGLGFIR